jgi:hypothetical protein
VASVIVVPLMSVTLPMTKPSGVRLTDGLAAADAAGLAAALADASADAPGEAEASVFVLPAHPANTADRTNTQIISGMIFLFM